MHIQLAWYFEYTFDRPSDLRKQEKHVFLKKMIFIHFFNRRKPSIPNEKLLNIKKNKNKKIMCHMAIMPKD